MACSQQQTAEAGDLAAAHRPPTRHCAACALRPGVVMGDDTGDGGREASMTLVSPLSTLPCTFHIQPEAKARRCHSRRRVHDTEGWFVEPQCQWGASIEGRRPNQHGVVVPRFKREAVETKPSGSEPLSHDMTAV